MKDRHIYKLNKNLNSLAQLENPENDAIRKMPSPNFYIKSADDEPTDVHFTLIDGIHNVTDIIKKHADSKDTVTYHLVLRDETLTGLFFDLKNQGYESEIRYRIGKTTFINMSIGNIELKIKTQLLTTISIERSLIVHD